MSSVNKTREELVKDFQELRKEHNALKALYEKDITNFKQVEEKLTISETNYRRLFETAKDGIILLDAETGMITDVNPFLIELLGYSKAQFLEKTIWEIGFFKDIVANQDKFLELQQKGYVRYHDLPLETIDGRKIRVEFVSNVYPVNHHYVIQCNIRDITDRRQAAEMLLENEAKYRTMITQSPDGIFIVDLSGGFLSVNKTMCDNLKYSEEEFLSMKIWDIVPQKYLSLHVNRMANILKGEINNEAAEYEIKGKDGIVHIIEVLSAPYYKGKEIIGLQGVARDITARKRAEEALHESENRYHELIEQVRDVVFLVSLQGLLQSLNQAFEHITGWRVEEWIGKPFIDLIHPEDVPLAMNRMSTVLNRQNAGAVELRIRKKSGDYVVSEILAAARMKNGMTIGLLGIGRDITDRKRIEKELIIAKEHAEESDRLKSAFLANMSHEIRTPMNGILGFAQLLKEPHLTFGEQKNFIQHIEKSSDRMLNLITNIVNISKIESGQMDVSISTTNVNEQIEKIYGTFKPDVEQKGMQLIVKTALSSKESIINTDSYKLHAILTYLVDNAIKFTNAGSIEFGYEKKDKHLAFFVSDTGIGIPDEKKELIFTRFRQGSESMTRGYEGAGLGLSIAKVYVEMLGGKIWLESELGKGSTFYFTIPYNAETEPEIITKEPVSVGDKDVIIKSLKILIVEDDESSELFLSTALDKHCKEILTTRTGIEAVEVCRNNPDLDLVLMDIRMPDMDGYEATRQIRQFNKKVIIIAQTAFGLSGDREKAIDAGCNGYIPKPVDISLLKALILEFCKK